MIEKKMLRQCLADQSVVDHDLCHDNLTKDWEWLIIRISWDLYIPISDGYKA